MVSVLLRQSGDALAVRRSWMLVKAQLALLLDANSITTS